MTDNELIDKWVRLINEKAGTEFDLRKLEYRTGKIEQAREFDKAEQLLTTNGLIKRPVRLELYPSCYMRGEKFAKVMTDEGWLKYLEQQEKEKASELNRTALQDEKLIGDLELVKSQIKHLPETIEKLKTDLGNAKRQLRYYYPLMMFTIAVGLASIYIGLTNTNSKRHLTQLLEWRDSLNISLKDIYQELDSLWLNSANKSEDTIEPLNK